MKIILSFISFLIFTTQIKSQDLDTIYVENQLKIAQELEYENRDSSLEIANRMLEYSKKLDFQSGEASARVRIASIFNLNGKNEEALNEYKKAFVIREKISDYKGQINILIGYSYIYTEKGELDSAFLVLFKAENIASENSLNEKKASILIEIGNLFKKYENQEKSLEYINKAKQVAKEIQNQEILVYLNFAFADYYFSIDSILIALDYYKILNEKLIDENDTRILAQNFNNIAACYTELGNYPLAIRYYKFAQEHFEEVSSGSDLSLVYFNLGTLYYAIDLYDSSLVLLQKSRLISRVIGDAYRELMAENYLAEVYYMLDKPDDALAHYRVYDSLKEVILNEERIQSISEMQTKYETEIKEQQIEILDEQNRTKTAQRNFLLAGIFILIVVAGGLIISYRQKQKLAKQQEELATKKLESILDEQEIKTYNAMLEGQEEERMRIANDLHDRLGSMLSTIKLMFGSLEDKIDKVQEENKEQYSKATNLIDEACVEVRRISHNLGSGMIANYGLTHSLEDLCETLNHTKKINARLLTYNMEEGLPLKYEVELYRIVQEVVNNALKHAKAEQLIIQINRLEEELSLTIEDDGIGFNLEEKLESEGLGLGSIKKRAEKLNGTLFIDSEVGKGTITIVEIPLV